MNKKIRIGIDIDNVVLDFTQKFIDCFYEDFNIKLDRDEIDSWDIQSSIDKKFNNSMEKDLVTKMLFSGRLVSDMEYKPLSLETILDMNKNTNIEIVFVTALEKELSHIRKAWFEENLKDVKYELHFEHVKSKIPMDYLIDDGVHNLDELSKHIPYDNCLCIIEPYNKDCRYKKFNNLKEAYIHILEKENLK